MKFIWREEIPLSSLNVFSDHGWSVTQWNRVNFRDCNTVVHDIGRSFVLVQRPSINTRPLKVNKAKLTMLWAWSVHGLTKLKCWLKREKGYACSMIMRVTKSRSYNFKLSFFLRKISFSNVSPFLSFSTFLSFFFF